MTQAKATVWTQADANGFYWWRYDKDATPEPVEVRDGMFYCIADPDPTSASVGEFLGPITPELSNERDALLREVVQLREAAECAQIELAYIVNLADRKGGRYEEALSKLNAALAKERYAVIQQK
jgi:hypothetical protein